jgi:hypothetical protein
MRRSSSLFTLSALIGGLFFTSVSLLGQTNACDLNGDGTVNSADVQLAINMSLGLTGCTANIAGANVCNVIVVQRVVNASLGGACLTSTGIHSVSLNWAASSSTGVTGYNVYRATTSGGPYTLVSSVGLTTSFTDNTVQSGTKYYYVVSAVGGSSTASPYSNQVQAVVPVP